MKESRIDMSESTEVVAVHVDNPPAERGCVRQPGCARTTPGRRGPCQGAGLAGRRVPEAPELLVLTYAKPPALSREDAAKSDVSTSIIRYAH